MPCAPPHSRAPWKNAPGLAATGRRGCGRPARWAAPSVRVGACGLDDGAPLVDLGLHELLVLGRLDALVGGHHGAQAFLLLDEVGVLQGGLEGFVQLGHHLGGRALGCIEAVPDGDLEVLHAGLGQRGQVLERGRGEALVGGDRIGLDLLGLDLRGGVGRLVAQQIDLAADQVGDGRGRALVGDGGHLDLERVLVEQAAQVRGGAQAGVAQVDLALVLLDPGREFLVVVGGQRGAADERHGHVVHDAQVLEVGGHVERQLAVERRHRGHGDVVEQQGVAVGVGARHLGGADAAAGACGVVDHHAHPAQRLAHGLGQVACHAVGGTAGREGHDDGHRLVLGGEGLLRLDAESGGYGSGQQGGLEQ